MENQGYINRQIYQHIPNWNKAVLTDSMLRHNWPHIITEGKKEIITLSSTLQSQNESNVEAQSMVKYNKICFKFTGLWGIKNLNTNVVP